MKTFILCRTNRGWLQPICPRYLVQVVSVIAVTLAMSHLLQPQVNATTPDDSTRRPNIVLIMADDLGWKDLHCYGNDRLDTPHLDRLATQGMRFTHGYAASPVCSPTRAAMMTGQAPARIRLTNHAPGHPRRFHLKDSDLQEADWIRHLPLEYVTIAERLKKAGYATGFIGKWHLSYRQRNHRGHPTERELRPQHQGFDINIGGNQFGGPPSYFEPYKIPNIKPRRDGDYLPERLADDAIAFIKKNRDQPFYLNWWNYSVHYPHQAPEHLVKKYQDRKGPGIKNPTFAAMIEGMDTAIGRVLEAIDDMGLASETLVIFTSDNGSYDGDNRPLRGGKGHLHEGGIRVPWIIRWPGVIEPGSTCSTPVISMDCFPTLLQVAGLQLAPDELLDGESLFPLLTQSGTLKRDALYFHYPHYAFHKRNRMGSAIRMGDYKLIRWFDDDSVELYNLATDIGETNNLANHQPERVRMMTRKLQTWLQGTQAQLPTRRSADENG